MSVLESVCKSLELKLASWNSEWMYSFFKPEESVLWDTFPGKKLGSIKLERIDDVKGLCKRIGKMLAAIRADVITIVEGPQLKEQMELFVRNYLDDAYEVYTHAETKELQKIHILVRKNLGAVELFALNDPSMQLLRGKFSYYPWVEYEENKKKTAGLARIPVVVRLNLQSGQKVVVAALHTKSKISKLKKREQWERRDKEAVLDALNSRQKLSGEIAQVRQFLDEQLKPDGLSALLVMGDFNDGPFRDELEKEFLIMNILDEMQGSFLKPTLRLFHSMPTDVLSAEYSTIFNDPFGGDQPVKELIDHILVSRGIAEDKTMRIKPDSALVEHKAYDDCNDEDQNKRARDLRPSDHIPVSVILT